MNSKLLAIGLVQFVCVMPTLAADLDVVSRSDSSAGRVVAATIRGPVATCQTPFEPGSTFEFDSAHSTLTLKLSSSTTDLSEESVHQWNRERLLALQQVKTAKQTVLDDPHTPDGVRALVQKYGDAPSTTTPISAQLAITSTASSGAQPIPVLQDLMSRLQEYRQLVRKEIPTDAGADSVFTCVYDISRVPFTASGGPLKQPLLFLTEAPPTGIATTQSSKARKPISQLFGQRDNGR